MRVHQLRRLAVLFCLAQALAACGSGSSGGGAPPPPANRAPVAAFTVAPPGTDVGVTVTLDASGSSDPDGDALTYAWSLGDGRTATGQVTTASFAVAGTYTVTLTVQDPAGFTSNTTRSVTVTAPVGNRAPVPAFSVGPASPVALSPVTLDAGATADPDGDALTYRWALGDGREAAGKVLSVAYPAAGTYHVTLTAVDAAGASASLSHPVTVSSLPAATPASVAARVINVYGEPIPGATVASGASSALTGANGYATLEVATGQTAVVTATLAGFVTQAVRVVLPDGAASADVALTLLFANVPQPVDADLGGTVTAWLGAQVTFPAGAFVDGAGQPVTGTVDVRLTPLDIGPGSLDVAAFPGGGLAVGTAGDLTRLVSLGMMDVALSQGGLPVRLAPGKQATLQMDLGVTHFDGSLLAEGTPVPLWWFDEGTGLWVEEGEGQVVAKQDGSGLAVVASVAHFTPWNWDYAWPPTTGRTIRVKCQVLDGAGALVDLPPGQLCYLQVLLTQPGEPSRYATFPGVEAAGVDVTGFPDGATLTVTAYSGGKKGSVSTTAPPDTLVIPVTTDVTGDVYFDPGLTITGYDPAGVPVTLVNNLPALSESRVVYQGVTYPLQRWGCYELPCLINEGGTLRLHTANETGSYTLEQYWAPEAGGTGVVATARVEVTADLAPSTPALRLPDMVFPDPAAGVVALVRGTFGRPVTAVRVDGVAYAACDPGARTDITLVVPPCYLADYAGRFDHAYVAVAMTEPSGVHALEVTVGGVTASAPLSILQPAPGALGLPLAVTLPADRVAAMAHPWARSLRPASGNPAAGPHLEQLSRMADTPYWTDLLASTDGAAWAGQFQVTEAFDSVAVLETISVTVTPTPGRFMGVQVTSRCEPFDLTAGAQIPFASPVWEVLPLGRWSLLPVLSQAGVIEPTTAANGSFLVRVTNPADPADFIEALVLLHGCGV